MTVARFGVVALVVLGALVAGCDGDSGGAEVEPGDPELTEPSFGAMTHDARVDFMKHVVLPAMKKEFVAFEPEEFSMMKCSACHGADAKARKFEMPNPDLPPLPTDPAGWEKLETEDAAAMKFMQETVVPKMAELLGEAPYDADTGEGFGCFECHTTQ